MEKSLLKNMHDRPWLGSCCLLIASLFILWSPVRLVESTIIPAQTVWSALCIGGLMLAMALVTLLAPSQNVVAGAIALTLALLSLPVALGGLGIGLILGTIGSCYTLAWRPTISKTKPRLFWGILGSSIGMIILMGTLITNGVMAATVPLVGPFTLFVGRLDCYNTTAQPGISQVDHKTPVIVQHSDHCNLSNIVITQHILGHTLTIKEAQRGLFIGHGITLEYVATSTGRATVLDQTLSVKNGLTQTASETITYNTTFDVLLQTIDSATTTDTTAYID